MANYFIDRLVLLNNLAIIMSFAIMALTGLQ